MYTEKNDDIYVDKDYASLGEDNVSVEVPYGATNGAMSDAISVNAMPTNEYSSDSSKFEEQLSDFKRDREFILLTLKSALKSRYYEDALDIVFQYRFALETDIEFRRLAELAKSASQDRDAAKRLLLILEEAPEKDYVQRRAIYDELLTIDSSNQSYKNGYRLVSQALGIDGKWDKAAERRRLNPFRIAFIWLGITVFGTLVWSYFLVNSTPPDYPQEVVPSDTINTDATDNSKIKDNVEPRVYKDSPEP